MSRGRQACFLYHFLDYCKRNLLVLCPDLDLTEFSEPNVFNYSTLLLSEKGDALYVGAREAIFELSKKNVSVRNNKVT